MFNNLKGNKKKVMAGGISLVLAAAIVAGIVAGVRSTTSSTVAVLPVADLNYGNYLDWQNSVTGMITTEAEQNVYLSDTEKVEEVLVQEGQAVHKGDVLLRYDTRGTELKLEKEKLNREKIELAITVAKENIKILENTSPTSDGGDFDLVWDFGEFDQVDTLSKAQVHEHILKADAKPVSDDPEDVFLGSEETPYVFLCKGDSVVITRDFIKKWQKAAAKKKAKHLYIALQVRDSAQALQKAWITDIMLLDPLYDIEVDTATGKTSYASMNKPEELAQLLRKILTDVPEEERGAWLAALMDKLLITPESDKKEEQLAERGALLAGMLNELCGNDLYKENFAEEFAAAAALLDGKTLSLMFKGLSENLTTEQIEGIDSDSLAAMLTMLLENARKEQIQAMEPVVLSAFLQKLSAKQIEKIDSRVIAAFFNGLSETQIKGLDKEFLTKLFTEMTDTQIASIASLDPEKMKAFFKNLTEEQLQALIDLRREKIEELLARQKDDGKKSEINENDPPVIPKDPDPTEVPKPAEKTEEAVQEAKEPVQEQTKEPEEPQEPAQEPEEPAQVSEEPAQVPEEEPGEEPAQDDNAAGGESVPATASAPGTGTGSGSQLLSGDVSYSSDELAKARREAQDKLRDLQVDLKESEIKIEKAQNALDKGVVTAGMDGIIKTAGDPKAPPTDGSAFITVSGTEGLYVKSGIKESKLGTIKEGDIVMVTSWQTGGQYPAEIKSISPYPDSTGMFDGSGTETYYPFTAVVNDKSAQMMNGEWVEVSYTTSESAGSSNTLTVLKAFVREEGNKKYVYKRDENGKLAKQYIITGTLSDNGYEVLDGLSASDWVAFPYGKNVKEGAKTREASMRELYE